MNTAKHEHEPSIEGVPKSRTDYDVTTFANRVRPMVDSFIGDTEKGNEHPALLTANLAFIDTATMDQPADSFYLSATMAFKKIGYPYVVFPSNMLSETVIDICIMQTDLFVESLNKTLEDETIDTFIEGAVNQEIVLELKKLIEEAPCSNNG